MDHVYTQLPYAVPVVIGSAIGFWITGMVDCSKIWISVLLPLAAGTTTSLLLMLLFNFLSNKSQNQRK
jgi:hypothetical protein